MSLTEEIANLTEASEKLTQTIIDKEAVINQSLAEGIENLSKAENLTSGTIPSQRLLGGSYVVESITSERYDGKFIDLDFNDETTDSTIYQLNMTMLSTNTDNITNNRTKVAGYFNNNIYAPDNGADITGQRFYADGVRSYVSVSGGSGDVRDIYGTRSYATLQKGFTGGAVSVAGGIHAGITNTDGDIIVLRGGTAYAQTNAAANIKYMYGGDIQCNPNDNASGSADYAYGVLIALNDDSGGKFTYNTRKAVTYMTASGALSGGGDTYGIYQDGLITNNRLLGGIDLDSGGMRFSGGSTMSHYEKVDFTPSFNGAPSATTRHGKAIRIGDKVDIYMRIKGTAAQRTSLSGATTLQFGNIPWISELFTEMNSMVNVYEGYGDYDYSTTCQSQSGVVSAGSDVILLWNEKESGRNIKTIADWASGDFFFNIHASFICN